jgi:hypothetical protein
LKGKETKMSKKSRPPVRELKRSLGGAKGLSPIPKGEKAGGGGGKKLSPKPPKTN